MKKTLFFSIFLIWFFPFSSTSQVWKWVINPGKSQLDEGTGIAADQHSNIYIVGDFMSDSITFGSYTLYSANANNMFIVKYNLQTGVVWAKSANNGAEVGPQIAVDKFGNSYVTGWYKQSSPIFGKDTLPNFNYKTAIYLVKYDLSGNVVWAKSFGNIKASCLSFCVTTDSLGYVYIAGNWSGLGGDSLKFGNVKFVQSPNWTQVFVVKFDSAGNGIWGRQANGGTISDALGVAADKYENIYTTGRYNTDSLKFGTYTLYSPYPKSNNSTSAFIAKYDSSGKFIWARSSGCDSIDNGSSVAIDQNGQIYIAGNFISDSIKFGPFILLKTSSLTSSFIVKYDTAGNPIWAKTVCGNIYPFSNAITTDGLGNIFITGTIDGGGNVFGSDTLNGVGSTDIFVAKYDTAGNILGAKRAGGSGEDWPFAIASDGTGNVYVTGQFGSDSVTYNSFVTVYPGIFYAQVGSNPSGINSLKNLRSNILVYPNPATNKVYISLKSNNKESLCQLYNITGQEIWNSSIAANTSIFEIPLQNLSNGVYLLKLQTGDGGTLVKKVEVLK